MSTPDFTLRCRLPASPAALYAAWLDGEQHAAMTGAAASSEPRVGGRFTAWEGYIEGEYLALEPHRAIVMAWRTSEFPEEAPSARVEVLLQADGDGAELVVVQAGTPPDQVESYRQGWEDYYFAPMRAWLGG